MSDQTTVWPDGYTCAATITVDVDGEAAMINIDQKYVEHPAVMAHASYGPRVGVPRLLRILARYDVAATFFVPGFTATLYPSLVREIVERGHEVACHGFMHEAPIGISECHEHDILRRSIEVLEKTSLVRPLGYRAPQGTPSLATPRLLAEEGLIYDSSLPDDDVPYLVETSAGTVVELPMTWAHDDWEQYAFLMEPDVGHTIESPAKVSDLWQRGLRAAHREGLYFMGIMHPELSGSPARAEVLSEALATGKDLGVWFGRAVDVARWTLSQNESLTARPPYSPIEVP